MKERWNRIRYAVDMPNGEVLQMEMIILPDETKACFCYRCELLWDTVTHAADTLEDKINKWKSTGAKG
jgi:hypothetical protein